MRTALCLVALAAACGPSALPPVRVLGIAPNAGRGSDSVAVVASVDAVPPFLVDYGAHAIDISSTATLSIGGRVVGSGPFADGGLSGETPSGLSPGVYDVTVTLADGRSGTLAGGYTVLPPAWPQGFRFDPLPSEQGGHAFPITLRALGANAATFNGTVTLSVSSGRGAVSPVTTAPFQNGVLQQAVTVTGNPNVTLHLTATDANGDTGVSNDFLVQP